MYDSDVFLGLFFRALGGLVVWCSLLVLVVCCGFGFAWFLLRGLCGLC